jgi:hypothetical protein
VLNFAKSSFLYGEELLNCPIFTLQDFCLSAKDYALKLTTAQSGCCHLLTEKKRGAMSLSEWLTLRNKVCIKQI